MVVEVCAYSLESSINAEKAGAGRIELCGGLGEGGTTPSAGLIQQVKSKVNLPVYVMIRPRGGDFIYNEQEIELMHADIDIARQYGADGVVLGVLHANGTVNIEATRSLVERAAGMGVTFHRAFDVTRDASEALEAVIQTGAERILTSGLKANVTLGLNTIRELTTQAANRIEIMAGAGVGAKNAVLLKEAGVGSIHLTGKKFRASEQAYYPEGVSMAGEVPDEKSIMYADVAIVKEVVQLVNT